MSNKRFFDDLQLDLKTNVFALVGIEAGVDYKEFKNASSMDWYLVQSICKDLLSYCIYQIMINFCISLMKN